MKKVKMFFLVATVISILLTLGASAASEITKDYSVTISGETTSSAILEYDKGTKILFILTSPAEVRTTVNVPKSSVSNVSFFCAGHSINNWNTYASNSDSTRTCDSDGVTTLATELEDNQYATHVTHVASVSYNGEEDINYSDSPVQ